MRALQNATGKTSAELDEMMKQGKLTSEYIKPLIDEIGKLALANGAYEKALKKLGTVENQLKASGGYAAARIAEAGFTEGLVKLYKELMNSMEENGSSLDKLGNIYNNVFSGLAKVVRAVTPILASLIRILDLIVEHPFIPALGLITGGLWAASKAADGFGKALMIALKGPLAVITMIATLMDEVFAIFDPNLVGAGENINASEEDRKIAAYSAKGVFATEDEKKYLAKYSKDRINQALSNNGGLPMLFGMDLAAKAKQAVTEPVSNFESWINNSSAGKWWDETTGRTSPAIGQATISISITSPDPALSGEQVKNALFGVTDLAMAPKR